MRTKYLTICLFIRDVSVERAKGRTFPKISSVLYPTFDVQYGRPKKVAENKWELKPCGIAVNFLGIRVRASL